MSHASHRGFTLIELIVSVALLGILINGALYFSQTLLPKTRLVADTNQVIGLIAQARNTAISRQVTLLCATGTQCATFDKNTHNLMLIVDHNNNHRQDSNEPILAQTTLHRDTRVNWNSFQSKPYLAFRPSGLAHFQNGHFLICGQKLANKVVLNWVGRAYIEKVDYHTHCKAS